MYKRQKVLRDGKIVTLKSEDLVPGDIVVLEAGDAVPADGRIIESASMKIEEAALTGESVPVNKAAELLPLGGQKDIPLGDRKTVSYTHLISSVSEEQSVPQPMS